MISEFDGLDTITRSSTPSVNMRNILIGEMGWGLGFGLGGWRYRGSLDVGGRSEQALLLYLSLSWLDGRWFKRSLKHKLTKVSHSSVATVMRVRVSGVCVCVCVGDRDPARDGRCESERGTREMMRGEERRRPSAVCSVKSAPQ